MADVKQPTISTASQKLLEQILAKKKRYNIKMDKKSNRSLELNPTIDNLYEVVATLVRDLQEAQILGKK
jgi:hypothetical protein